VHNFEVAVLGVARQEMSRGCPFVHRDPSSSQIQSHHEAELQMEIYLSGNNLQCTSTFRLFFSLGIHTVFMHRQWVIISFSFYCSYCNFPVRTYIGSGPKLWERIDSGAKHRRMKN